MLQVWKQWTLATALGVVLSAVASAQTSPTTFSGVTAVGSAATAASVTLTVQASGSVGSLNVLTAGAPNLDFSLVSAGNCTGNLIAGQTCTATVTFTPLYPGVRQGAIEAQTSGGQVLASALLSGVAQGSLPVLVPGTISTIAGDSQWIYQGDGVAANSSAIFLPAGLAVDGAGNLFLCDSSNNRVRRVDAKTGLISTVAGNGSPGGAGDGGAAIAAELSNPSGIAIDGAGNLYIADSGNNVVRMVDGNTGVISTFAGQNGTSGYSGDNGPAKSALLASPHGLALTPGGDLVIADTANNAVRVVNVTSNRISTVAGTGNAGYNGDGRPGTTAMLDAPYGVSVRLDGAIAIADSRSHRVRLITTAGIISTLAGTGQQGFAGDGALPADADLNAPEAVAFDPAGDLLIADSGNNRVRIALNTSPATIQTIIGADSEQFTGDGGPSNLATLYDPSGLFFDATGNIWLSDTFHNRVREVTGSLLTLQYPTMKVGKTSAALLEAMYNQGNADLTLGAPILNQAALDSASTTCSGMAMSPGSACKMGVEFAPTQVGSAIQGSITWPSNAPNVTPLDKLSGAVLSVNVTSTALTGTPNPGTVGNPVTLKAAVSSDGATTGTITFSEGGSTWCSMVTMNTSGVATCTIPGLSLGSHTFTASYSGDDYNASSTSPSYTEVIKQQAALGLTVSPNPAIVTNTVTLTMSAVAPSGTPTGNVTFYDSGTALGTVALDGSGTAQMATQGLNVGTHVISAQYAGDGSNLSGTSNSVSERINQASTATALSTSASTATVGSAVTLTATVTNGNGPSLTGYVTFKNAGLTIASQPVGASGICSVVVSTLAPGTHSLTAVYSGDTDDAASSSVAMTESIEPIATVTTLGTDANPLSAGATLHLTAVVSLAPNATADGALTGSVTFYDGGAMLGAGPVAIDVNGQATLAVSTLSVGSHALTASFGGSRNYGASNSAPLGETVQQTGTQTVLTLASSTTLMGKPASFTAVVTSGTGTPTGAVSFRDGTTTLGTTSLNANGTASFTTSTLSHGTHSITAGYNGDSNYTPSVSAAAQQTVVLAQPSLTLSGPTNAVDAGTLAGFTAVLTTPGIAPTGTLLLLDGGTTIGSVTVNGATTYSFSITTLAIGTHTLTASYGGDADNSSATSAAFTVTVKQASSATALTASVNPLTLGGALTLTATVTSDSPNAGGQINFFNGPALLGTAQLGSHSMASFSTTSLVLGSHSLVAVYAGDTNHAGSSSTPVSELVVTAAMVSLTSNANPSASGQTVTFTAQISGSSRYIASGTATFRDNGALLGTVPLNGVGAAVLTTNALAVGSHTVTVAYGGDQNYASGSAQLIQTVTDANTQMTLSASANPAVYAQPLSLTATVTSNGGTATGRVTFTDGGAAIGSAPLNGAGVAILTLSTLAPGSHIVVAAYPGDGKADPSASTPLALSVKQTTGLAVIASSNPGQTLSSLSFTASLTNAGAAPATGAISFTDGGAPIGTANLDGTGHATLTLPGMSAGSHTILASYAGDGANFSSSSAVLNESVQLRPTMTTVTGSATDLTNPQQVTLIAVVEGQGSVPPGGTVTFTSGSVTLGQATVSPGGVATITVLFAQPTESIIASYPGDANYAGSQTAGTTIVAGTAAQFTLAVTSPSITVVTHQHATVQVNLGSVKGFTDTIALGCLGLPLEGTCTFTPSQLKLSADGTAVATLIVDTGDPLGSGTGTGSTTASLKRSGGAMLAFLPFGLLAGLLLGRKKNKAVLQRLGMLCLFLMAGAFTIGAAGCGGLTTTATAPGTYTIKVVGTGQGSGITETQTITLVVTQ